LCEGETATFTAAAGGTPAPTVQWQVSTDGGATFADVPGGTSTTLSFSAALAQDGDRFHAVFPNAPGPAATAPTLLTGKPNAHLSVGMTATPGPVAAGATITYTVTVTNTGPSSAPNVVLTETLPPGATYESAVPSQGSCGHVTDVSCPLGTIASGA